MDFTDTSRLWAEQVVQDIVEQGRHLFAEPLIPCATAELLADIRAVRRFETDLFLDEEAFNASPQLFAPAPGRTGRIAEVSDALRGPLSLSATRVDLAEDGAARLKHNAVNRA